MVTLSKRFVEMNVSKSSLELNLVYELVILEDTINRVIFTNQFPQLVHCICKYLELFLKHSILQTSFFEQWFIYGFYKSIFITIFITFITYIISITIFITNLVANLFITIFISNLQDTIVFIISTTTFIISSINILVTIHLLKQLIF